MIPAQCRDCGYEFEPTSRGCPRCALNLEAEAMIDRLVLRTLPVLLIGVASIVIIYIIYSR
jgi:hypothetical protein